jgi:flagellar biosynthesis chaperone FliJ
VHKIIFPLTHEKGEKPMNKYEMALLCLSFLYERFCQVAETARRKGVSAHVIDSNMQSFEDNFDQLTDIIKDLKNEMEQRLFWQ